MCVFVSCLYVFFFFFQAEDGIRDWSVTGVQTCALPILLPSPALLGDLANADPELLRRYPDVSALEAALAARVGVAPERLRSEERRVGKEWRARWAADAGKKNEEEHTSRGCRAKNE